MPDRIKITIKGNDELQAALKRIRAVAQGSNLTIAAKVGILPIQNRIIETAPYLTGTYARSWHFEPIEETATSAYVITGSDIEYGPRLEFGFEDTDSLGRSYHQPARPHVRPAYENTQAEAVAEVTAALVALIKAVAPTVG